VGLVTGRAGIGPVSRWSAQNGYLAWVGPGDQGIPGQGVCEALRHRFGAEIEEKFTVTGSDEPVTRVGG
jgi:hypothetical protein